MRTFGKGLVIAATVATALCAAGLVQARSERPARPLDVAPLTVTLAPPSASNLIGTQHTVTATVTDSAPAPVEGASVTFTVTGANPTSGTVTTATDGTAAFTYTGSVAGDDTIAAQAVVLSGTDVIAQGDATPATKTWTSSGRRAARCSPLRMPRFPSSRTRRPPAQRLTSRTRRRVRRSSRVALRRTSRRAGTSQQPRRARHWEQRRIRRRSPTRG